MPTMYFGCEAPQTGRISPWIRRRAVLQGAFGTEVLDGRRVRFSKIAGVLILPVKAERLRHTDPDLVIRSQHNMRPHSEAMQRNGE